MNAKKRTVRTAGIILVNPDGHFLLCHPTNSPGDVWSLPKGLPEPDEGYYYAAERELFEETGIKLTEIDRCNMEHIGTFDYDNKNKKLFAIVLFLEGYPTNVLDCSSMVAGVWLNTKTNEAVDIEFPEIDNYFWASREQAKGLVNKATQDALDEAYKIYGERIA